MSSHYNNAFKCYLLFNSMDREKKIKVGIIAGASAAAKYLKENKNATVEETIKHVNKEIDGIVYNINKDY